LNVSKIRQTKRGRKVVKIGRCLEYLNI